MNLHKGQTDEFAEGDHCAYVSVTQGHLVTWTRDADGWWHADDESWTHRGPASDDEVREAIAAMPAPRQNADINGGSS